MALRHRILVSAAAAAPAQATESAVPCCPVACLFADAMPASKGNGAGQQAALQEPIEELPDRRLHFSRSVTLVRCLLQGIWVM